MRYSAVALLFAALASSTVLAQSTQLSEVPVRPQPAAPLRLSVQAYGLHPGYVGVRFSVENVSGRDIGSYGIRRAFAGEGRSESVPGWRGQLPSFSFPGRPLRPGRVDVTDNGDPTLGQLLPRL